MCVFVCFCCSPGSRFPGGKHSMYPRRWHVSPPGEIYSQPFRGCFCTDDFLDDLVLCVQHPTSVPTCEQGSVWIWFEQSFVSPGLQRVVLQLRSLFEPVRQCCHWLCSSPPSSSVYCGSPGSDLNHFYHRLYTHKHKQINVCTRIDLILSHSPMCL